MAGAGGMARPVRSRHSHFDILDEEAGTVNERYPSATAERDVLAELLVDNVQNDRRDTPNTLLDNIDFSTMQKLQAPSAVEPKSLTAKIFSKGATRRPPVDAETFKPLNAVQEEPMGLSEYKASVHAQARQLRTGGATQDNHALTKPEQTVSRKHGAEYDTDAEDLTSSEFEGEVDNTLWKHLRGQFEWLVSCPAKATSAEYHVIPPIEKSGFANDRKDDMIFGCNMLRRWAGTSRRECPSTNRYTLLATALEADHTPIMPVPEMSERLVNQIVTAIGQPSATNDASLKPPATIEVTEQAISPSLTTVTERSDSFADKSSHSGSFSIPRIEDSLEELDRLEDELEAVNAVAQPRHVAFAQVKNDEVESDEPSGKKKPSTAKKVTIAPPPYATMRVKPSPKVAKPALRRSNSLTFRDAPSASPAQDSDRQQTSGTSLTRSKSTNFRADPWTPIKSTKPLTVPNFQLSGVEVALRLKEQRELRQAQQAQDELHRLAEAAAAKPARPKSSKPLTRPNFELPGEAISRRKREEKEAKLKAQEEEEKRRRQFKARPFRQPSTPTTLPRETVASRARQGKPLGDEAEANKTKRLSLAAGSFKDVSPGLSNSIRSRGRNSMILPVEAGSRGTSASTGSLSAEDVVQQRIRGREIYARDNSFCHDREQEKREREAIAKSAREQAAERSRVASREWAEKKRRKEQELKDTMRTRTRY